MRRRKHKRRKSNLPSKIWKIGLGVLILFLALDAYLLATSRIFNIKFVEIVFDKVKCTDENVIKNELSVLGKNFFQINGQNIENQIKDKHFCMRFIRLSRIFPDKIKIEVFGREPVAIVSILKTDESTSSANPEHVASLSATFTKDRIIDEFLVDSEGVIFSKADQSNIPRVFYWGKLSIGKKIEEKIIQNSLITLAKLKSFDLSIKDSIIYPDNTFLLSPINDKPKIFFSLEKNIEFQLASLQLILTQAKIEEQEMEFIDLRYDKPAVKYILKKR